MTCFEFVYGCSDLSLGGLHNIVADWVGLTMLLFEFAVSFLGFTITAISCDCFGFGFGFWWVC